VTGGTYVLLTADQSTISCTWHVQSMACGASRWTLHDLIRDGSTLVDVCKPRLPRAVWQLKPQTGSHSLAT
jgi:hypothetical protein